ncbi:MAG: VWA domain-containing protein [Candidatus Dependentiae bacterium]|nr:VWA domain-containing protein [Candidatus Dependentiae bacterium]
MQSISWAGLNNLALALSLSFIVFIFLLIRWFKTARALDRLALKKWRDLLVHNASLTRRIIKTALFLIGFCFLMLALLRPQWDKKDELVEQEGRDLLIAVDISRSMLAQDVKPNRLEFVKKKIKKLLCNLSCERVGLLLFSGETVLQCPLTTDYSAFFMFLDGLDVETISSGTTTIEGALSRAMAIFESMPTKKTKLICLFTDGEDFSTNLAGVKSKAEQQGLSVFTFGVGTSRGAPIPIVDHKGACVGFEKDDKGSIVMSKLNEEILKNLSEQTGGKYIRMVQSDDDIKQFISIVKSFEKDSLEGRSVSRFQEQYPYFIAVSFICFAVEWLL